MKQMGCTNQKNRHWSKRKLTTKKKNIAAMRIPTATDGSVIRLKRSCWNYLLEMFKHFRNYPVL